MNWFVGIDVLAPPAGGDVVLPPADVVFETMRASGPRGQHVDKTESAARATHKPASGAAFPPLIRCVYGV